MADVTSIDLTAVCERHGIELMMHGGNARDAVTQAADEQYVCALLKARYRIATAFNDGTRLWCAVSWSGMEHSPTELAAVVALADRLAGGGE